MWRNPDSAIREVYASEIPNLEKVCFWNIVESGIQLKESGIPQAIGMWHPRSTDKARILVPGIQNPTLFWIPLHGEKLFVGFWFVEMYSGFQSSKSGSHQEPGADTPDNQQLR